MTPIEIVAFVVLAFAALVTVHVIGSLNFAMQGPRWTGVAALLIPPVFPYFALRRHAIGWLVAWCAALVLYAVALAIAFTWR